MAATLERGADPVRQANRVLRRLIRKARRKLAGNAVSDTDIHAARKHIKRARAVLRLLRETLPAGAYRRQNKLLRDAARPLSVARDAKVLVEACAGLLQRSARARGPGGARRLQRSLESARQEAQRETVRSRKGLRHSGRLLG